MSDAEWNQTKEKFQRVTGKKVFRAVQGDSNGVVWDDPVNRPGLMRITYTTAAGMSLPPTLRIGPNFSGQIKAGTPVICKYDENDTLVVWGSDIPAQAAQGFNPVQNISEDLRGSKTTASTELPILKPASTSPVSLVVTVSSFFYFNGSVVHLFDAGDKSSGTYKGRIDLTSFIPATAGYQCLACIFLKTTDDTLEAKASTAKSTLDPLGVADVQECATAAVAGDVPVVAYRLYYGQTTITDADRWLDLRPIINIPRYGRTATAISYAMLATDNIVAVTDTTAARTITLPPANAVTPGWPYVVQDEYGTAGTNNITVARAGGDTVNGTTSKAISTNYGRLTLYSDGSSKWFAA